MAQPGWYPDPSGQPDTFRYWDGHAWSEETSPSPYVPPPGATPPPPPPGPPPSAPPGPSATPEAGGQPGPPGWTPMSAPPGTASGGTGKTVLVVVLAVVLVLVVGVGSFLGVRALSGGDDEATSPETKEPTAAAPTDDETDATEEGDETEAPSDACNAGSPMGGSPVDSHLRGGGLSMPVPQGFEARGWEPIIPTFTFADEVSLVARVIQTDKWIANYTLGGLPTEPGYDSLDEAAEAVMACMAGSSSFFQGFESRTDLDSEETEVDGREAWQLVSEIRVDDPDLEVEGDRVTVVVVDTGAQQRHGLFISVVPIGDDKLIRQAEKALDQLAVGGGGGSNA